jgi:hypothetical protein
MESRQHTVATSAGQNDPFALELADSEEVVEYVPPDTETNVLCCLFACLCGPVFDALCALPGAVLEDVPASLRTSSLVLAVLLGAPAVSNAGVLVLEQRGVLAILLASVAFIGLNQAEPAARNADAVFAFVGTLAATLATQTNGAFGNKHDTSDTTCKKREHLSAFCGSMLFYLGMRVVRHSFALSNEIINFKVSRDDINTRGYGVAIDLVAVGNCFAGSCTVGFACILLLNYDLVLHMGSSALSTIASVLSCFVFLGAFVAQMSSFAAMEQLPALFSSASCSGDQSECAAAYRARRLFLSANSTSVSWVCAIAMVIYAFSHSRRFRSRREHFEYEPSPYSLASIAVVACAVVACAAVFFFVDPGRSMDWSDWELLLLLLSIPACLLGWPGIACALHAGGEAIYIYTRVALHGGYDWSYFTHHSLLATMVLTATVGVLSTFSYGLYSVGRRRLYSEPVEIVNSVALTALVSIQTFLTLATLGMAAGFTGVYYEDGKGSWRISGFEFSVQHSVSFFFCAALYGTRYEHEALPATWRRAAWFAVPPLLGVSWLLVISLADSDGSPYHHYVDWVSFLVGVSAAGASWAGIGVFLHR